MRSLFYTRNNSSAKEKETKSELCITEDILIASTTGGIKWTQEYSVRIYTILYRMRSHDPFI